MLADMKVAQIAGLAGLIILSLVVFRLYFMPASLSDDTEPDWSSCEVTSTVKQDRFGRSRRTIECDGSVILYSTRRTNAKLPRGWTYKRAEQEVLSAMAEPTQIWFELLDFSGTHLETKSIGFGSVMGYTGKRHVIRSASNVDSKGDGAIEGHGMEVSARTPTMDIYAYCAARTTSHAYCENALATLMSGEYSELSNEQEGVSARDGDAPAPAAAAVAAKPTSKPAGTKQLDTIIMPSSEEVAAIRARGGDLYLDNCASCHNPGTPAEAPKIGDAVFKHADSDDFDALDGIKCKTVDGEPYKHAVGPAEVTAATLHMIMASDR